MKPYEDKYSSRKKVSNEIKKDLKKNSTFKIVLIHNIFDTINISLLGLIFVLSFLSFNSQREWSKTYKLLSKTRANNNNLLDYISKTEEFYISEFESLNTLKKTTPKDLIYLKKTLKNKEKFLDIKLKSIINGLKDSKYQRGY